MELSEKEISKTLSKGKRSKEPALGGFIIVVTKKRREKGTHDLYLMAVREAAKRKTKRRVEERLKK